MYRLVALSVLALLALVSPQPALASVAFTRTFVSSAGSDSNPCTITQPCATFAAAYAAVASNGIVTALDPGKYGPLTITGPVTINGNGWAAITGPAGGDAVTINAVSGKVTLIGLEIDGARAATAGIAFISGDSLEVTACAVRNFLGSGIAFAPTVGSTSTVRLAVSNSILADNGGHGAFVQPAGSGFVQASFSRVEARNNSDDGIGIYGNNSTNSSSPFPGILGTVTDSVATGNGVGFHAFSAAGNAVVGFEVSRSMVASNGEGVAADGAPATLRIGQSQVVGNFNGWVQSGNGTVVSYGDNYIDDNDGANGSPPTSGVRK